MPGAKLVGAGRTTPDKPLFMGEAGVPFVTTKAPGYEGLTTTIRGEVYEVDQPTLAELDRLEGHPVWYYR